MKRKMNSKIHDAANQALRLPRLQSLTVFHVAMMPNDDEDKGDNEDDEDKNEDENEDDNEDEFDRDFMRHIVTQQNRFFEIEADLSSKIQVLTQEKTKAMDKIQVLTQEKTKAMDEVSRLQEVIDNERKETDKIAQVSIDRKMELYDLKARMAEMERKCATNDSISRQSLDAALAECEELQGNLERERKECARLRTEGDGYYKRIQDLSAKMLCIRACCEELSKKVISEEVRESISKIWHLA